ncbi:MAG: hypothetical protein KDB11_23260 [Planctomycetales bacterium]|nr:hypothetical protein [Planctomycetales bacterium]
MSHAALAALGILLTLFGTTSAQAGPPVSFELLMEGGFPVSGAQRWIEALKDLDHSGLRIRSGSPGDETQVTNRGTEASPSYHVVGLLLANNQLALPNGKFGLNDRAGIANWIRKLQDDGIEGLTTSKAAFGLTAEELVDFDKQLAIPIGFDTKGVRVGDVARTIVRSLPMEISVTDDARRAFSRNEAVLDELNGLSAGVSLAATLRPLGLVLSPDKPRGGKVRLVISDVREVTESWPVGWPPQATPRQVAPKLYEYLTVEIKETALSEAITAIQGRVDTPFLFDHNGMAREQIDVKDVKVSFPKKRVQYLRVLDQILFQAHLQSEVRLDEAGKPFLWISPRRS